MTHLRLSSLRPVCLSCNMYYVPIPFMLCVDLVCLPSFSLSSIFCVFIQPKVIITLVFWNVDIRSADIAHWTLLTKVNTTNSYWAKMIELDPADWIYDWCTLWNKCGDNQHIFSFWHFFMWTISVPQVCVKLA